MSDGIEQIENTGPRRFRSYPDYRDSGIEWLGEIPSHWDVAPVYARYEVALGKMLDSKRVTGEFSGPYLRNVDVQWDAVNTEELPEMDFAPGEYDRYLLRPGDLLVCEGGEVGRTAIWSGALAKCFYQKALHRVRPRKSDEVPRYFYYVMYAMAKRDLFTESGNQNTIDHLTAVQLRHYRFPFAQPSEQHEIVAFLDRETAKIDGLVARKERLIELLQEKRAALITRAVTRGLDPNVPMKDSGVVWLGEIPAHWDVARVKYLGNIASGFVPPGDFDKALGEYPVYGSNGLIGFCGQYLVSQETLAVGRVGASGLVNVIPPMSWITDNALVVRITSPTTCLAWLRYVLDTMNLGSQAAKNAQPIITGTFLSNQLLAVPSAHEQRAIAEFVKRETAKIDGLITKVHEAIDRLKEFRTALISAAVTGKIDVRTAAG